MTQSAAVLTLGEILVWAGPRRAPQAEGGPPDEPFPVQFRDVARSAGLGVKTIFGGEARNKYLLETTGCGVAFFDYDNDGWLDIFLVNGWRLEGFPEGQEPICHLFRNNRDGTFADVTLSAGIRSMGWGQGVCAGDFNNDGHEDLFITYYGKHVLYRNNGDGTFTDVTEKAGVQIQPPRWSTGCAFLDYDRDGHLDLFVANYIDLDLATAPTPESGPCLYKGIQVACGPPGLPGGTNLLYRNNGDGTFTDVSEESGIAVASGTYGLGVVVADFDNDGWPDIYVANDSTPAALYQNQGDGTFQDIGILVGAALSPDGKPQAGMGVAAGDYDRDGHFDIVKTNFAGDTDSLYRNRGDGSFEDATFPAGLGAITRYLAWGTGFFDMDNDGWPDILICNGHVYPEVAQLRTEAAYAQPKTLYHNLHDGRFEDVSARAGPGITVPVPARGCAFGDYDNDGTVDVVVNCVNDFPQLLRCESRTGNRWLKVRLVGTESNRSAIGARVRCAARLDGKTLHIQMDEVRSGSSYLSQNDLRLHFGLGQAKQAEWLEIRWPNGETEKLAELKSNRLYHIKEGEGIIREETFAGRK